jgi:hypothetical protein
MVASTILKSPIYHGNRNASVPVNLFDEEESILMRDDYTGGPK